MAQCWRLGPADFWHGPTGSHPSDSLTRIPASSCRHKEPNSAEVQFVHQYELLLSHPLLPSLSATSPLSFVIAIPKLSVAESRDSLCGLAHGFSPQTISAIPASSEKSTSLISRRQTKLGLAVLAQAALINQLWKSIT